MRRCTELATAHTAMLRRCLADKCVPPESRLFADERCYFLMKRQFSSCHDQCNVPSGPNPSLRKQVCYVEMRPEETAKDCYRMPGDAQVYYY